MTFRDYFSQRMAALLLISTLLLIGCRHFATDIRVGPHDSLEQIYQKIVSEENAFDPDNSPGDIPVFRLSMMDGDRWAFWREYMSYQDRRGRGVAFARLKAIVNKWGLCMIMDSAFGRRVAGAEDFDQLLLSNRAKQTPLFKYAFGTGFAQAPEYLTGFPKQ